MIEKSLENDVHINELYILSHRHDNELHNAVTYKTTLLEKSVPRNIYNNDKTKGFLDLFQPMIIHMITSNVITRNFFNWTVNKFYDRHSN